MTAQDYKITFAYGAYGEAGYTKLRPHRGNDRPCPNGTPVVIEGTQIGLTGATGLVTGAHLHTQSGTDKACQNTFDGNGVTEFKAGTVVATGTASQWGKYVTLQVGDKYVTYCHLSEINVQIGQRIGEEMLNDGDSKNVTELFDEKDSRFKNQAWSAVFYNYLSGKIKQLKKDLDNATRIANERYRQINELIDNQDDAEKTLQQIKELVNKKG